MSDTITSIDPATGEAVWQGLACDERDVRKAVSEARAAFPAWAARPLSERLAAVTRFKDALGERKGKLAETISRETGKPRWETEAEVATMIAKVDVSIKAQAERAGERSADMPFGQAVLRHKPHGVMAVLGPYNFPGHLPNGHIVPALLAGNTVVFKPSEMTPATGEAMADAWKASGLPEGVFALVQGGRSTGEALVDADIDGLLFTGSAGAGAHFRRAFANRPHVVLALELGGNNPLVAWDGDVEEAAAVAVQSAFITTGQRCSCARRLIVPDTAFGTKLVAAIDAMAARLIVGPWNADPQPFMGPLVSVEAARRARAQVQALIDAGATMLRESTVPDGLSDAFMTPALLDVTGVDAPDEEIFAPVLQVRRVADFDAALAAANDTRFGLSAGLVSEDESLWRRFAIESRAGVVNWNRPTTGAAGSMPFGGLGDSGNHRPSAYYAADYCAWPAASFEAADASGNMDAIRARLRA